MSEFGDGFDDGLDPRLRTCIRELRLAPTPVAALSALKRELRQLAPTIFDKQAIVDALMPIAEDCGLTREVGEAVTYAIAHALNAPPLQPQNGNGGGDPTSAPWEDESEADSQEAASYLDNVPMSIGAWDTRDIPEPDRLLGDWFTTTSRTLLVASTGIGKTLFGVGIGIGMSAGAGFLHWRGVRPCRVLFVDGEMSSRLLKKRIVDEVARCGLRPEGMHFLSHDDIENFQPLNTPQGQALIEAVIKRIGHVDGILFDNVMSLIEGDMKDEEAWRQTIPWILSLTRRSIGQAWVHHTGHDETRSYGTKTREWMMDTVIHLDRVEQPDTDVSFRLSFKKARERTPDTRADFADMSVALVDNTWTFSAGGTVKNNASPLGEKFLAALKSASGGHLKAIPLDRWREQCVKRGLIDPDEKPDSARTLFSKYRRELIAANLVVSNETEAWVL